jgi:hypothetical protein
MRGTESAQLSATLALAGEHPLGPSSNSPDPPSTPKPGLRAPPSNIPPTKAPTTGLLRSPRLDKLWSEWSEWSKERSDVPAQRKSLWLDVSIPLVGDSVQSPPSLVPRTDRGSLPGTWSGPKAHSTPTRPLPKRRTVGQDPPSPALSLPQLDTSAPASAVVGSSSRKRVADPTPQQSPETEFLNPDLTTDVSESSLPTKGAKGTESAGGQDSIASRKQATSCTEDGVVPPGTPCLGAATGRKSTAAERDRSAGYGSGPLEETGYGEAGIAFPASVSDGASKRIMERVVLNGSCHSKSCWFRLRCETAFFP